jgi:hypothetical protein
MLSRRLLARGSLLLATAIAVSSCGNSTGNGTTSLIPGSPPLRRPVAGSTTTKPNYFADVVKIDFHNNTGLKLKARTLFSYPILPGWHESREQCVDPHGDWTSSIGFKYPDGQVGIMVVNDDCGQPRGPRGGIFFKSIQFSDERATITGQVDSFFAHLLLCGRQTDPISGKRECTDIPKR